MTEAVDLARFLTYRLHRIARLSDRETAAVYAAQCDLKLGEARCLAAIGAFESLSMNDLARAANQDKGHASRSVQALVDEGLVAKSTSEEDARGVVLGLTRKGRARFAKIMTLIEQRNEATFGVLTAAERRTLGLLLDRVALALEPS